LLRTGTAGNQMTKHRQRQKPRKYPEQIRLRLRRVPGATNLVFEFVREDRSARESKGPRGRIDRMLLLKTDIWKRTVLLPHWRTVSQFHAEEQALDYRQPILPS
jgi:hypothetical protein